MRIGATVNPARRSRNTWYTGSRRREPAARPVGPVRMRSCALTPSHLLALLLRHLDDVPNGVRRGDRGRTGGGDDLAPEDVPLVVVGLLRDSAPAVRAHGGPPFSSWAVSNANAR